MTREKEKLIRVSELALDRLNVRHISEGAFFSEKEIISYLTKSEKVYEIAKDISQDGMSPLDVVAVVPENGHYTVLEGNRRVCALKLLNDPSLAGSTRQKSIYRNLARRAAGEIPDEIKCHVFKNRDDGGKWMNLKHTSGQPAGLRPWRPSAKALHDKKSPDRLASQLKTYAISQKIFPKNVIDGISTTTLTRYLKTPEVREALGITSPTDLFVQWKRADFNKITKIFLDDAIAKTVNSRTNVGDRVGYARKLGAKVKSSWNKTSEQLNLVPGGWKPKGAKKPEKTSTSRTRSTKGIIDNQWPGFAFLGIEAQDQRIGSIAGELRDCDCDKQPFAAGCLLRMLMECSVRRYLNWPSAKTKKLKDLYKMAEKKLQAETDRHTTTALRTAISDNDHYLSPDIHSAWVHGRLTPTKNEIVRVWQNFGPIIEKFLEAGKPQQKDS